MDKLKEIWDNAKQKSPLLQALTRKEYFSDYQAAKDMQIMERYATTLITINVILVAINVAIAVIQLKQWWQQ